MACISGNGPNSEANAEFIAAARSALPALIARVEELEGALRDFLPETFHEEARFGEREDLIRAIEERVDRAHSLLSQSPKSEPAAPPPTEDKGGGA